ncbi:ribosomal protein [Lithospermum erythrorhizon]|uniref:Large ribosomal subunit protein uL4m n=1 Tax=Lithospermum erythrorhizon TaxID=34254 RepID=A0AAV3Q0Y5_LITER
MAMFISRKLVRSFASSNSIPKNALRYCLPSTESFAFGKNESFLPCQRLSTSILTPGADENQFPRHMLSKKTVPTLEVEIGLKKDKLIPVTNFQNEDKGMIVLPGDVFDVPIRKDIVQRVVRWQLAKRQQGTHSTKTISEVSGTGRKPWPQKGTGRARHGTLHSNQFRGGAIMHGPKPRSHAIKLNKKVRKLGLKIALSAYAAEGKLHVFDDFEMPSHKTKNIVNWVKQMENCKKFLLVDGGPIEEKLKLSTQNLYYVNVLPSIGLNVYSILLHDTLVMSRSAVDMIVNRVMVTKPDLSIQDCPAPQLYEADIKGGSAEES